MLVVMCGIPFAGKSTLANAIAERCGMQVVGVDAVVRERGIDVGADGRRGIGWARAIAETFQRMRPMLVAGESMVFDHANHTRLSRDRCRELATASQARCVVVWVDTDPVTAWARLQANRTVQERSDVPDAAFRQIADEFEPPNDEPDVIRWRSSMPIEELGARLCGDLSRDLSSKRYVNGSRGPDLGSGKPST